MENKRKREVFNEVTSIISGAIAVLLLLSFLSYNPDGTNFFGDRIEKDSNLIGRLGNRIADGTLQLTGLGAYFLTAICFYITYIGLSRRKKEIGSLAFVGFIFGILSFCALVTTLFPYTARMRSGGIIGKFLSTVAASQIGNIGASIIFIAILGISFLSVTKISPTQILKYIGGFMLKITNQLYVFITKKRIKARYSLPIQAKGPKRRKVSLGKKLKTRIIISHNTNSSSDRHPQSKNKRTSFWKPRTEEEKEETEEEYLSYRNLQKKAKIPWDQDIVTRPSIRDEQEHYGKENIDARTKKEHGWKLPSIELLDYKPTISHIDEDLLDENTMNIVNKLKEFRIEGQITQIHPGPVVTTYEFKPAPGIKYSRVVNLVDDLCLALRAENIRIARMVGKSTIGIEVPNTTQQPIYLREVIDSPVFTSSSNKLTLALGKTIVGKNYVTDLTRMPHLLMAGTTGSGKSVSINAMICSILYNSTPDEVKFIMIDPKRLELGIYEDIPHLLTPVVTDPHLAAAALMWAVYEMNERLKQLSKFSVRDIEHYNTLINDKRKKITGKVRDEIPKPIPYLVVVVDELSDLMIVSSSKVEEAITRLSQMARAVGIHLIVATQRPSVDVITGIIKANMPSRISFRVFSKIDSRVILDSQGAEKLLGRGDMLLIPPGSASQMRIHGALVTERELEKVINFWKKQGIPTYDERLDEQFEAVAEATFKKKGILPFFDDSAGGEDDEVLYKLARRIVVSTRKASISNLQRKMKIGYNRAARLMDMMEEEGIVGPADGAKPRSVLVPKDYFEDIKE